LVSIGRGAWQLFIQNVISDSDFIRYELGYTEKVPVSRKFEKTRDGIITPLQPGSDKIFLCEYNSAQMKNSRILMLFQAVKRVGKNKRVPVAVYVALSPTPSNWKTTVGSITDLEITKIETINNELPSGDLRIVG